MNHPFDQHGTWSGPGENDFDPTTYKVRLTLHDDSVVELYASEIEQISQNMGDVRSIHDICGIHPLFGPRYCPKCKANNNLDGCGQYFVVATQTSEPALIEVQLKDGRVLYAKDYERVREKSKDFDPSPFQRVASKLSGFASLPFAPFPGLVNQAIEKERQVTEIAALVGVTTDEVKEFYRSHNYGLEFIRAVVRLGAKLTEEDIKRTMEERVGYGYTADWSGLADGIKNPELEAFIKSFTPEQYTFIITTPDSDRTPYKAAYCELDGGCLILEDDNRETIMAWAAGHWVKVERVEEDDQND